MTYFVSYFATYETGKQCWGNCTVLRDHVIDSADEYQSMEELIAKEFNMKQVTIMYWRKLEDSE